MRLYSIRPDYCLALRMIANQEFHRRNQEFVERVFGENMKITETTEKIIPETHEIRVYFSGYVTPELLQDVRHSGHGMSYEKLGKIFVEELDVKRKITNEDTLF